MITSKIVFPTLIDVFYGKEGFDPKERVRMKRINLSWRIVGMPLVSDNEEIEHGKVTSLWAVLPEINQHLEDTYGKAPRPSKK